MDYMSARAAAESWGISERRVQKLCEQGRVPGAGRFGRNWILPKDARKPEDRRLARGSENAAGASPPISAGGNALSMLRKAWDLKTRGLDDAFNAMLDELLPAVKERRDEPELYGEWLLLSSFRHHPRLAEMTGALKAAAPYFMGKRSRVIPPSSLFPFAGLGVFSAYHTRPGGAREEARSLEEFISAYSKLTGGNGAGADIAFRAEMLFHGGDLNAAHILAYKALYAAREKKQAAVELSSALLLGQIALCRGDAGGWQSAVDAMSPAHEDARNAEALQRMADAVRGILILELTHPDGIADWLKTGDFDALASLPQLLPFAHFVHAQYLCRKGEFARLIGFAEALYPRGIEASPVLDALLSLAVATACLNAGDEMQAEALIQRAADRALPDGLVFLIGSYVQLLGGLLEETVKESYPACLPAFLRLKSRLALAGRRLGGHIVTIVKTAGLPDDLTPREREVARLAAQGLRNSEIARRLAVTENTVRYHLRSAFHKLDVDRRMKLAEKLL